MKTNTKTSALSRVLALLLTLAMLLNLNGFQVLAGELDTQAAEAGAVEGSAEVPAEVQEPEEPAVTEETVEPAEPEITEEPTEETTEPAEEPTEPEEEPVEPTETPVEPTEEPAEPTETPAEPIETPAEPTEEPVEPTETPAEPTETPVPTETPEEVTSEAAFLEQILAEGTIVVSADIPEGAFQAKADQLSLRVQTPDYVETYQALMDEDLQPGSFSNGGFLYHIEFLVNGVPAEPAKPVLLTIQTAMLQYEDAIAVPVYKYNPDTQKMDRMASVLGLTGYYQTGNTGEYYEVVSSDTVSDKILIQAMKSGIYGMRVEKQKIQEEAVFTADVNGVRVSLTAPQDAFPENAYNPDGTCRVTMNAEPLAADEEAALLDQLNEQAAEDGMKVSSFVVYDITLWLDGEEIQPLVPVSVAFENLPEPVEETIGFQLDEETNEIIEVNEDLASEVMKTSTAAAVEVEHFTPTGVYSLEVDEASPKNYEMTLEETGKESQEEESGSSESEAGTEEGKEESILKFQASVTSLKGIEEGRLTLVPSIIDMPVPAEGEDGENSGEASEGTETEGTPVDVPVASNGETVVEVLNPVTLNANETWEQEFEILQSSVAGLKNPALKVSLMSGKNEIMTMSTGIMPIADYTRRTPGHLGEMPGFTSQAVTNPNTFEHHKTIDFLGDGHDNEDTDIDNKDSQIENLDEYYRLYLDITGGSQPTDLVLVVDNSGSMRRAVYNDTAPGENGYVVPAGDSRNDAIVDILNGYHDENGVLKEGIISHFLNANKENQIAVVKFGGHTVPDGDVYYPSNYPFPGNKDYTYETDAQIIKNWTNESFTYENVTPPLAGTNYEAALYQAANLFANDQIENDGKKHVMIFISDGQPTNFLRVDDGYNPRDIYDEKDEKDNALDYDTEAALGRAGYYISDLEQGYFTSHYYRGGNAHNYDFAKEPTLKAIDEFKAKDSNLVIYTIGLQTAGLENSCLEAMVANGGSFMEASNRDGLYTVLWSALFPNAVEIVDTLSSYVDFAVKDLSDVKVTIKSGEDATTIYENGKVTDAGKGILSESQPVTKDGKVIKLKFLNSYNLEQGRTYTLSFNVRLTDEAKEQFRENGYNAAGEENTDYTGNKTSSLYPGFYSNEEKNTAVSYQFGSDENTRKSENYEMPVVQYYKATKSVDINNDKVDDSGTSVGVGQELTYTIRYTTQQAGTVTITDKLPEEVDYDKDQAVEVEVNVPGSGTPGWTGTCTQTPAKGDGEASWDTLVWTLTDVPQGAEIAVTFKVKVNETAINNYKDVNRNDKVCDLVNEATVSINGGPEVKTDPVNDPVPYKEEVKPGEGKLVLPGDEIEYKIYWKNGEKEKRTILIKDFLDPNVELVDSAKYPENAEWTEASGHYERTITDAAPGQEGFVSLKVKVKESALSVGKVENKAAVKVGNQDEVETNKVENPTFKPEKTEETPGPGKSVVGGQVITYRISWKNYTDDETEITVRDFLDSKDNDGTAGLTYVEDSTRIVKYESGVDPKETEKAKGEDANPNEITGTTLTWIFKAESGEEGYIEFKARVNENAFNDGKLDVINQASVTVNGNEQETNTVENPLEEPEKHVTEVNGDTPEDKANWDDRLVKVGDKLTYTITWENTNTDEATVEIMDTLSPGLTYVAESVTAKISEGEGTLGEITEGQVGKKLTWTFTAPKNSKGTLSFQAEVVLEEGAEIKELPSVDNTSEVGVAVKDNPFVYVPTNTVKNPIPHKEEVTPGNEKEVAVGDIITYRVFWENAYDEARAVTIKDILDEGLDYEGQPVNLAVMTPSETTLETIFTSEDDDLLWKFTAPANSKGYVEFQAKVNEKALLTRAEKGDPNAAHEDQHVYNKASVQIGDDPEVETNEVENPVWNPEKKETVPGEGVKVKEGTEITYQITWKNYTNDSAKITVIDHLDSVTDNDNGGLEFVAGSARIVNKDGTAVSEGEDAKPEITDDGRTLTWTIENVDPGKEGYVEFRAKVTEQAFADNKFDVRNQAEVIVGNGSEHKTNIVENPLDDQPEKHVTQINDDSAEDGDLVKPGDVLTYEITWKNTEDTAADVIITDVLDEDVIFVSASEGYDYDEETHTVTWTLKADANTSGSVTLKVKVSEEALEDYRVDNTAGVKVGNQSEVKTNTVKNPIPHKEEVTPGNEKEVTVGDTITYQVFWENAYDGERSVTIKDNLDEGLDYVNASADVVMTTPSGIPGGIKFNSENDHLTWEFTAPANSKGYVEFQAKVNEKALLTRAEKGDPNEAHEDQHVYNKASVKIGTDREVETNEVENPVWNPEKKETVPGEGVKVKEGTEITYQITWKNYTNDSAKITVIDHLDSVTDNDNGGLEFVAGSARIVNKDGTAVSEGEDAKPEITDDGRTLTWTIENVDPGKEGYVEFRAKVTEQAFADNKFDVRNQAEVIVGNGSEHKTNIVENPLDDQPEKHVTQINGEDAEDGDQVRVGDRITYTISWSNDQKEPASVVITDELDPGVKFVGASDPGKHEAGTVTWNLGEQAAGAKGSVTLTVEVTEKAYDTENENTVDNDATVRVGNVAKVTNKVKDPLPEKEEESPGAGKLVGVGDEITYDISWENAKEKKAQVTITDELDPGVDFVRAEPSGSYDNASHTVTWDLGEQLAGAKGTVHLVVRVNEKAHVTHKVENEATVDVDHDPKVTNKVENPLPEKEEKTPGAGKLVGVGSEITYDISWKNTKDEEAQVTITDVLDPGVDFVSAVSADSSGSYDDASRTVTWDLGKQAAGAEGTVHLVVRVNEKAHVTHKVENEATVEVDHDPKVTNKVENPVPEKKLTENNDDSAEDGDLVKPGDVLTYEITWENTEDTAADVIITDALDEDVTFVSASEGYDYDEEIHTVTWTLKADANTSGSVTLKVKVSEEALEDYRVDNTAGVKVGNESDVEVKTNTVKNPIPHKEEVTPGNEKEVAVGDIITYRVFWENAYDEARAVTIKDTLDEGLDYEGQPVNLAVMTPSETTLETIFTSEDDDLLWKFTAPANSRGYVQFQAKVNEKALLTRAEKGDPNTAHEDQHVYNKASVQIGTDPEVETNEVENPVWNPEKKETVPGEGDLVNVGTEITYEITWKNYQQQPAEVVIKDTLDPGVNPVSCSEPGTYDEETRTYTWYLGVKQPGEDGSVTLTVVVNENAHLNEGEKVVNKASVQVGNSSVYTNEVKNPVPEKTETEPGNLEDVRVGETIHYEVSWENAYDVEADVVITDVLDPGLEYLNGTASPGGSYDSDTRTLTWKFKADAGAKGIVSFDAKVTQEAVVKEKVENQAAVQVGTKPAVKTNKVENPVPYPKKRETDPGNKVGVQIGQVITYEIDYENYKEKEAVVVIRDTLDPGLDFVSAENGGRYDEATRTVIWNLSNVAAGTSGTVTFKAKVNEKALAEHKDLVENQAGVKVDDDPEVLTNIVENPVTKQEKTEPTPGDGKLTGVGETITYEIHWQNYKEETVTVTITDPLDEGLTYVEGSATNGGVYDEKTHTITWTLENASPRGTQGSFGTVSFQAKVNEKALDENNDNDVINYADVQVGDDPKIRTNEVENPVPEKEKSVPGGGSRVSVGDTVTYTIRWENGYDVPAEVVITDKLDAALNYVDRSAGENAVYTDGDRTITWNLGIQPAGAKGSVSFQAVVNSNAVAEAVIPNTADVKIGNESAVTTNKQEITITEPEKTEVTPGENRLVPVGETIEYSISWENYRAVPATVTVKDTLDEGLDFLSAENGGTYDPSTRTVTWELRDRAAGETGTVTFKAVVNEKALDENNNNDVENQARVQVGDSPEVWTNIVENPVPEKEEVNRQPGDGVRPGDEITYSISWENAYDDEEGADVVITDTLDEGLTYQEDSADNGGTYDAASRTLTWEFHADANTKGTVTFTAVVNEKALDAGEVVNDADVRIGDDPAVTTQPLTNPTTEPEKTEDYPGDGQGVKVGDTITYHVSYENYEEEEATVIITDTLDEGLDLVSVEDGGIYDEASRTITWTLEKVPGRKAAESGEASNKGTVSFKALVNDQAVVIVENQASVKVGDHPAVDTNIVTNPVTEPKKTEIIPGDGVMVGLDQEITYSIQWQNYKDADAVVTITDELDEGLDFVRFVGTPTGEYNEETRVITWTISAKARGTVGSSGAVTFTAKVNEKAFGDDHKVINQAEVQVDHDAKVKTDIVENPVPEKTELTPGEGRTVVPGELITYSIHWVNGHDEAADVTITDELDDALIMDEDGEISDGGVYDPDTHTITWILKEQEAKAEGDVTFTAKVSDVILEKGEAVNDADVQIGNDAAVTTNKVENPAPNPEKTENTPGEDEVVQVGDTITYTITWKNYEEEAAEVTITDPLDIGLDFADADFDGSYDPDTHTVTWSLGEQPAGEEGFVTLTVTVNDKARKNGLVENQAGVQVGNDPEIKTDIIPNPVPKTDKTEVTPGENDMVQPGDEITYEIIWNNYEEETADVIITDPLDPGVDFSDADNGGVYDEASHTVTWTLEAQEAGAEGVVTLIVTVNEDAKDAGLVENQAGVKVGNNDEVKTRVIPNPVPNPEKEEMEPGRDEMVQPGDEITYEISWRNYRDEAADVVITDTLDEGLDFQSADNGGLYDVETRTVTWRLAGQPAGEEGIVTLIVTVNDQARTNGLVENQAGVQVGDDPEVKTDVIPNPVPNPEKTETLPGNGEEVHPYDVITYEITYRNYKAEPATVTITDPLDPGLDFSEAGEGGEYDESAHTVTWVLENVAPGEEGVVHLTVIVNEDAKSDDYLVENQAGVQVDHDPVIDTDIVENPVPDLPENGTIEVTKNLLYNDEPLNAADAVYYVALYTDAECTNMIPDTMKAIEFVNASSSTVVYEDVEVGRTYYVGEVDADGNLIEVMGTVEDGTEFFVNFYDGNETVVEEPDGTVTITFNNEFLSIPDGYTLNGILNITKKLLGADGRPADSDEVFYAGIFDDAEFTQLSSQVDYNVVALELGGGSETTVSVNVIAFKGDEERTVYVTEVDEDGVPVDDSFAYEVTITDGTAVFNESHVRHDVVITNQPKDHSDDKPGTPVSPTPIPSGGKGSNPVKTGDDTPIGLYVSLLAAAILAMGSAFWFRRRRNK